MSWTVKKNGSLTGVRGDTARLKFVHKSAGVATNLTGCTVKSEVRSKPNGYVVFEFTPDYTQLATGIFYLNATAVVTAAINKEEAVWDVQLTWPSGTVDTVIPPSEVIIIKDVSL